MFRQRILIVLVVLATMALCIVPALAFAGDYQPSQRSYTIKAMNTGYSWYDNTPAESADICCGVLHENAGGLGTFKDPITVAVPGSQGDLETPPGTRLYFPHARRYGIVEDAGASKYARKHFDWWVNGKGYPKADSDECMNDITGVYPIVVNPKPGLPVTVGSLTGPGGCRITRLAAAG
jgi:hypothetical protein